MARKKQSDQIMIDQEQKMQAENELAAAKAASDLAQIAAVENQTKTMEQEAQNKEHDEELSQSKEVDDNLAVVGTDEISEALATLMKYKDNKTELEERLINNEKIFKMQHWDVAIENALKEGNKSADRIRPKSGWAQNTIMNKHADAMDNFPEANILPRSRDDIEVAKQLSSIIPVVLEQADFEKVYSDVQWYKQKTGTGVYGVFWNNELDNGLGNIDIKKIDLTRLYWKSGISDIQDSPNVFLVTMMDNDEIKERYPEIDNALGSIPISANDQLNYGVDVDTSEMTAVVDWYYKKRVKGVDAMGIPQTKTVLHYCKFCNGTVIYASENDPNFAEKGWYDHGKYPFVVDTLIPVEASLAGLGYIDMIADDQMYIDKLQQAILENAIANARPRYLSRGEEGNINEDELLDSSKPVVHVEGDLSEASFKQIVVNPLSSIYETVYLQKVQEMKETSGNTPTSQGQTSSVTTASGIASLMEASGKLSRDATSQSYRAYKELIILVIELIRQFYTESRCFRITGESGEQEFIDFDNRNLVEQHQGFLPDGMGGSIDLGSRLPILDIEVKTQKRSAYSKETQNQTALQLYSMGFFAPANADASLACLNMMEFEDIEKMRDMVAGNGQLYQMVQQLQAQLVQLAQIVDAQNGSTLTQALTGQAQATSAINNGAAQEEKSGSISEGSKGSLPTQAANNTREATAPR